MLKRYLPNERTVLTRNPYWFGVDKKGQRLPYLDELVFMVVPDAEAADLKFSAGEADAITQPSSSNAQWYADHQREGGFTVHDLGPDLAVSVLFFNQNIGVDGSEPPVGRVKASWFQNPSFRRAVSMAIDRDSIIRSVHSGRAVKSWAYATPGDRLWGALDVPHDDFDPEAALRLLHSIGFTDRTGDGTLEDSAGNPVAFTLTTSTNSAATVATANFIRDELARLIVGSFDDNTRKQWLLELETLVNRQALVVWLPVPVRSKPVRNGFGNLHPSVLSNTATGILWNAEEIFVSSHARPTN
jgi:peptide/nickel transport system substrate-binding protein